MFFIFLHLFIKKHTFHLKTLDPHTPLILDELFTIVLGCSENKQHSLNTKPLIITTCCRLVLIYLKINSMFETYKMIT